MGGYGATSAGVFFAEIPKAARISGNTTQFGGNFVLENCIVAFDASYRVRGGRRNFKVYSWSVLSTEEEEGVSSPKVKGRHKSNNEEELAKSSKTMEEQLSLQQDANIPQAVRAPSL